MLLYDYYRSSAAYRVRIALSLKGLAAERRFVHLRRGEQRAAAYLEVNPQGLVPTLVIGQRRLTQSLAIIEYLDEKHPNPPLLPPGPEDRAWVRAMALAIACDIHPLNNTRVLKYLAEELELPEPTRDEWYRHWVTEGFRAIEAQLAERPQGRFCFGDTPTIADVFLVPQVANARRVTTPLEPYPRIRAIEQACLALPEFDRARPENNPDAE
ncbi:MAG TPA: maleylacetoacetate isomerase [Usitatibacter sp.]|jgi:maleylpyruvate isomerase|nr:maleylacetoacetate isomerase [Usitatibacter sp.]